MGEKSACHISEARANTDQAIRAFYYLSYLRGGSGTTVYADRQRMGLVDHTFGCACGCINMVEQSHEIGAGVVFSSVGHGTAFDIAGRGVADPGAVLRALDIVAPASAELVQ